MYLIIRRLNSLFVHVARLGNDTSAHQVLHCQINIFLGRLPDLTWKRPQVAQEASDWINNLWSADLWRCAICRRHSGSTVRWRWCHVIMLFMNVWQSMCVCTDRYVLLWLQGVQMSTKKKLCSIKGLSEAKVDKIKEVTVKLSKVLGCHVIQLVAVVKLHWTA